MKTKFNQILIILVTIILFSCSEKEKNIELPTKIDPLIGKWTQVVENPATAMKCEEKEALIFNDDFSATREDYDAVEENGKTICKLDKENSFNFKWKKEGDNYFFIVKDKNKDKEIPVKITFEDNKIILEFPDSKEVYKKS